MLWCDAPHVFGIIPHDGDSGGSYSNGSSNGVGGGNGCGSGRGCGSSNSY